MITFAIVAVCVVVLVLVLVQVQTGGPLVVLDGRINAGLLRLRRPPMIAVFAWLTQAGTGGTGAAIALVASGLLWSCGRGASIGPFWLTFLGAETTTWSLKFITARVRPPFLEGVTAASPSFPSAHATVSMTIFGFGALTAADGQSLSARVAIIAAAALLVALISFSRLLLSLHYFTDVIAGGLIGAAWLAVGWHLVAG